MLIIWAFLALSAVAIALTVEGDIANRGYSVPGSDTSRIATILHAHFPKTSGSILAAVISARYDAPNNHDRRYSTILEKRGLRAEHQRLRMINSMDNLPEISAEGVVGNTHYVDHRSQLAQTEIVSLNTNLSVQDTEARIPAIEDALARVSSSRDSFGLIGAAVISRRYAQLAHQDLRRAELIALPVIFVILTIAFLSITAALLPVVLAIVSFAITLSALHLFSLHQGLSVFVTSTASAVALGLSIDYALFMALLTFPWVT